MAENNKPDKTEQPVSDHNVTQYAPEGSQSLDLTAEEAATLAHEGEAALQDIGEEQLEPPTPFDIGGNIPCECP